MSEIALFDTHTHLDAEDFNPDQSDVIKRAQEAGVSRFVTIGAGDGFASAERALALAKKYDFIWASAGIHPHNAREELNIDLLRKLASDPRVVAIGETGLDFYRDWAPVDLQYHWFRAQIELAKELKKPLIIHSRDAGKACLETLIELQAQEVGGVFHCYSEDIEFAKKLLDINFLISVPGSVTFKKADKLREVVKALPVTQLMLETDAPYLAPEPHRGKRCESSMMLETAKVVARVREMELPELAAQTTNNALKFFKIKA